MYYKRLRDLREDKDLTQKQISQYLGITQPQYQLYESGKREIPAHFIVLLSEYYKVSTDYLLGLQD
ncbi:helix-turn-helix domain-containing protein [Agathobaculum sp.]|uniref:helix-turn-helix domain-containing protein n=1 Tax=Agathobaculum sp. TaxID=2048138 RepID=UPI002A824B42|nr:helix-turn-helix transcriptional regulator [Agathobaculum sp.]MDY3618428.1 helix-turn-helix transcriptional regulator [Agathobaculum sp.]